MADYEIISIGDEGQKLVVIDNFHPQFEKLRDESRRAKFGQVSKHYPGLQAPMNPSYLMAKAPLIEQAVKTVFGLTQTIRPVQCSASIITIPPGQLSVVQRLAHFDTTNPNRLALLHYMDSQSKGGTAFYRQKGTGFEYVDQARYPEFVKALEDSHEKYGLPPKSYMSGSNAYYEKIQSVEARPNRLIMYKSFTLHSGDIPRGLDFSPDPMTARLTINTFLQADGRA